jgi:hypothetical protein
MNDQLPEEDIDSKHCSLLPEAKIPRVIYVIWKTNNLFKEARLIDEDWRRREPCFERRIVTDDECRALSGRVNMDRSLDESGQNRSFQEAYDNLPTDVMKADVCRYLIVYFYGGIYMDLDVQWRYPLKEWLQEEKEERMIGVEDSKYGYLCNWIFAAKPLDECIGGVIDHLKTRVMRKDLHDWYLTYEHATHETAGPATMWDGVASACPSFKVQLTTADVRNLCVRHVFSSLSPSWYHDGQYKSWRQEREEKQKQYHEKEILRNKANRWNSWYSKRWTEEYKQMQAHAHVPSTNNWNKHLLQSQKKMEKKKNHLRN